MRPVFPKNKNKQMSTTKKGFDNKNKNEQKENVENEDNSAKKKFNDESIGAKCRCY